MQKVSPPSGVYVLTVIALILGIGFGQGGTQWILSSTRGRVIPVPPFVGGVFLVVGIIDIVAGVGFFVAKRWSWILGVFGSILTLNLSVLEVGAGGLPLSAGIISTIFPLIMIYYLTRPSVKTYLFFAKNVQD